MAFQGNSFFRLVVENEIVEAPLIPINELHLRRPGQTVRVRGKLQARECYDARWSLFRTELFFRLIVEDATGRVEARWSCQAGPRLLDKKIGPGQVVDVQGTWEERDHEGYIDACRGWRHPDYVICIL